MEDAVRVEVKMNNGKFKLVTDEKELPVDVLEGILNEVVDSTIKQVAGIMGKGQLFELKLHKAIGYASMVINVILIYMLMK